MPKLCKRSDATSGSRIVDTVPLDPTNTGSNIDYPTIDTRDFYIGYFGGRLTGLSIQKQTPTVEVGDSQSLPIGEAQTQTLGETDNERNTIVGFRRINTETLTYSSIVTVTRTPVSAATVTTTTTITEKVELPSQQVIYLRLVYGF